MRRDFSSHQLQVTKLHSCFQLLRLTAEGSYLKYMAANVNCCAVAVSAL